MFKKSFIHSIIVVLLTVTILTAATQTINTLPVSDSAFLATLQAFLRGENAARFQKRYAGYVLQGGIGGTSGTLAHTISALTAFPGGYYVYKDAIAHTYTANTRTFVYADYDSSRTITIAGAVIIRSTHLVFAEMAAGANEPTPPSNTVRLMRVDTSGVAITAVADLRTGGTIDVEVYGTLASAVNNAPPHVKLVLCQSQTADAPIVIPAGMTYAACPGAVLTTTAVNTFTFATGSHLEDNGGQIFDAAAGEVAGLKYVDASWFGDLSVDASSAIASAVGSLETITDNDYLPELFVPSGEYTISGDPAISVSKRLFFNARGVVFTKTGIGTAIIFSGSPVAISKIKVEGFKVTRSSTSTGVAATDWVGTGVEIGNVINSVFTDITVSNFGSGLKLAANGSGCSYNDFYNIHAKSNLMNIDVIYNAYNVANSFTTENRFYGGKVISAGKTDWSGSRLISHRKGNGALGPDGIRYFGMSIEGNAGGAATNVERKIYEEGNKNIWSQCRFEGSNGGIDIEITNLSYGDSFINNVEFGGNVVSDNSIIDETVNIGYKTIYIDKYNGFAINNLNPSTIFDIGRWTPAGGTVDFYHRNLGSGTTGNQVRELKTFKDSGGTNRVSGSLTWRQKTAGASSVTSQLLFGVGAIDGTWRDMLILDDDGQIKNVQRSATVDRGTMTTFSYHNDLADDGTLALPAATTGYLILSSSVGEGGVLLIKYDGTPIIVSGTTNLVNTDTDVKLCVYDGGDGAIIKNRLGSSKAIRFEYKY